MPINSEYDIEKAFRAVEDELIASMIRNMKRHRAEEVKEGFEWSAWQVEQLKSLEQYKKINRKKFQGTFADINKSIDVLVQKARLEGGMKEEVRILNAIKKGFKTSGRNGPGIRAKSTVEFFKLNDRKMDALIKATKKDFELGERAILRRAEDQYRQIIFNAQVYANSGAGTYEKAVDMATKDFLSRGIDSIEYSNGARHTMADYASMAIQTANKRAYLTGEAEKRKEWGITLVIMNKRGNPCPKCLPFAGKVLIDDVWSGGKASDGPYMLMSTAMNAGLYHPRCRDSHTTYFEGISSLPSSTFTRKEIEDIEARAKKQAKKQYQKRQAEKYSRLAEYSLDEDNRRQYSNKARRWFKLCRQEKGR